MEVVVMLVLLVVAVGLIIVAVIHLLPEPGASTVEHAGGRAGEGPVGGDARPAPTTLEGALVAQLLSGEISRFQYGNALARLAARDDKRHPMSVPGNERPDASA
jgi:hypothetical protein